MKLLHPNFLSHCWPIIRVTICQRFCVKMSDLLEVLYIGAGLWINRLAQASKKILLDSVTWPIACFTPYLIILSYWYCAQQKHLEEVTQPALKPRCVSGISKPQICKHILDKMEVKRYRFLQHKRCWNRERNCWRNSVGQGWKETCQDPPPYSPRRWTFAVVTGHGVRGGSQ